MSSSSSSSACSFALTLWSSNPKRRLIGRPAASKKPYAWYRASASSASTQSSISHSSSARGVRARGVAAAATQPRGRLGTQPAAATRSNM
eukprot:4300747-Prymnesium_polylepis.1